MITSAEVQAAHAALRHAEEQLYQTRKRNKACHAASTKTTAEVIDAFERAIVARAKYKAMMDAHLDQEAKEPAP